MDNKILVNSCASAGASANFTGGVRELFITMAANVKIIYMYICKIYTIRKRKCEFLFSENVDGWYCEIRQ